MSELVLIQFYHFVCKKKKTKQFSTDDEDSGSEGESEISEEEQESSVSDQGIGGDEGSSLGSFLVNTFL